MLYRVDIKNFRTHKDTVIGPFTNLSAIVGPNGSGKSNIVSSLEYVLNSRSVMASLFIENSVTARFFFLKENLSTEMKSTKKEGSKLQYSNQNRLKNQNTQKYYSNKQIDYNPNLISNQTHSNDQLLNDSNIGHGPFMNDPFQCVSDPNNLLNLLEDEFDLNVRHLKSHPLSFNFSSPDDPHVVIILTTDTLSEALSQYDDLLILEIVEHFEMNFESLHKSMKKDVHLNSKLNRLAVSHFTNNPTMTSNNGSNNCDPLVVELSPNNCNPPVLKPDNLITVEPDNLITDRPDDLLTLKPDNCTLQPNAETPVSLPNALSDHLRHHMSTYISDTLSSTRTSTFLKSPISLNLEILKDVLSLSEFLVLERVGHFFSINGVVLPHITFCAVLVLFNLDTAIFPLLNPSSYNQKDYKFLIQEDLNSSCKGLVSVTGSGMPNKDVLYGVSDSIALTRKSPNSPQESGTFPVNKRDKDSADSPIDTEERSVKNPMICDKDSTDSPIDTEERSVNNPTIGDTVSRENPVDIHVNSVNHHVISDKYLAKSTLNLPASDDPLFVLSVLPQLSLMTTSHILSLIMNVSLTSLLSPKIKTAQNTLSKLSIKLKNALEQRKRAQSTVKDLKVHKDSLKKQKFLFKKLIEAEKCFFLSLIQSEYKNSLSFYTKFSSYNKKFESFCNDFFKKHFVINCFESSVGVSCNDVEVFLFNLPLSCSKTVSTVVELYMLIKQIVEGYKDCELNKPDKNPNPNVTEMRGPHPNNLNESKNPNPNPNSHNPNDPNPNEIRDPSLNNSHNPNDPNPNSDDFHNPNDPNPNPNPNSYNSHNPNDPNTNPNPSLNNSHNPTDPNPNPNTSHNPNDPNPNPNTSHNPTDPNPNPNTSHNPTDPNPKPNLDGPIKLDSLVSLNAFIKGICNSVIDNSRRRIFSYQRVLFNSEKLISRISNEISSLRKHLIHSEDGVCSLKLTLSHISDLNNKIVSNLSVISDLSDRITECSIQSNNNVSIHSILTRKYGHEIDDRYNGKVYNGINSPYNGMKSPYNGMKSPYNGMKSPYNGMKSPYNGINSPYNNEIDSLNMNLDGQNLIGKHPVHSTDNEAVNTFHKTTFLDSAMKRALIEMFSKTDTRNAHFVAQISSLRISLQPKLDHLSSLNRKLESLSSYIDSLKKKRERLSASSVLLEINNLELQIIQLFHESVQGEYNQNTNESNVLNNPTSSNPILSNPTLSNPIFNDRLLSNSLFYRVAFLECLLKAVLNSLLTLKHQTKQSQRQLEDIDLINYLKAKFNLIGPLKELFSVNQKSYEVPISALIQNLSLIISSQSSSVIECVHYLKKSEKGKFSFLPMDSLKKIDYPPLDSYYDKNNKLNEKLINNNVNIENSNGSSSLFYAKDALTYSSAYNRVFEHVLEDSVIVGSFSFGRFLKYEMNFPGRICTLDGTLIHKNGFITGGHVQNKFREKERYDTQREITNDYQAIIHQYKRDGSGNNLINKSELIDNNIKNKSELIDNKSELIGNNLINGSGTFLLDGVWDELTALFHSNKSIDTLMKDLSRRGFFDDDRVSFTLFYIFRKHSNIFKNKIKDLIEIASKKIKREILLSLIINSPTAVIENTPLDAICHASRDFKDNSNNINNKLNNSNNNNLNNLNKLNNSNNKSNNSNNNNNKLNKLNNLNNSNNNNKCILSMIASFIDRVDSPLNGFYLCNNFCLNTLINNLLILKHKITANLTELKTKKDSLKSFNQTLIQIKTLFSEIKQKENISNQIESENKEIIKNIHSIETERNEISEKINEIENSVKEDELKINNLNGLINENELAELKGVMRKYRVDLPQLRMLREYIKETEMSREEMEGRESRLNLKIQLLTNENEIHIGEIKRELQRAFKVIKDEENNNEYQSLSITDENNYQGIPTIDKKRISTIDKKGIPTIDSEGISTIDHIVNEGIPTFDVKGISTFIGGCDFTVVPCFLDGMPFLHDKGIYDPIKLIYKSITERLSQLISYTNKYKKVLTDNSHNHKGTSMYIDKDSRLYNYKDRMEAFLGGLRGFIQKRLSELETEQIEAENSLRENKALLDSERVKYSQHKEEMERGCLEIDRLQSCTMEMQAMFDISMGKIQEIVNEAIIKGIQLPPAFKSSNQSDKYDNISDNENNTIDSHHNNTITALIHNGPLRCGLFEAVKNYFNSHSNVADVETMKLEVENVKEELQKIQTIEPTGKETDSEKLEEEIQALRKRQRDAQGELNTVRMTANRRFYSLFEGLSRLSNSIYKYLMQSDQVSIKMVIAKEQRSGSYNPNGGARENLQPNIRENIPNLQSNIRESIQSSIPTMPLCHEIDLQSFQIYAMPPMKKYTLISNLSGGEQTMVNISILLAIKELKKLSFTFYDEIDACLDLQNSRKLLEYLQTKQSNVVISHRPNVVSLCDSLIGVYKTTTSNIVTYML